MTPSVHDAYYELSQEKLEVEELLKAAEGKQQIKQTLSLAAS